MSLANFVNTRSPILLYQLLLAIAMRTAVPIDLYCYADIDYTAIARQSVSGTVSTDCLSVLSGVSTIHCDVYLTSRGF